VHLVLEQNGEKLFLVAAKKLKKTKLVLILINLANRANKGSLVLVEICDELLDQLGGLAVLVLMECEQEVLRVDRLINPSLSVNNLFLWVKTVLRFFIFTLHVCTSTSLFS
jgi:hypothetical protein